jgi:hypothetical protein
MSKREWSGCLLACALAVGCAHTDVSAPASSRLYTPDEIDHIMAMRDNGDGLTTVASAVGGSRSDVRSAERRELARRRQLRRPPALIRVLLGANEPR